MPRAVLPPALTRLLQSQWLPEPAEAARQMIARYGLPDEVSPSRMIWFHNYRNAPWKRSELLNERVPHQFPASHIDCLTQFVDMRIEPLMAGALTAFDGSVIFDRTKGEVGARCGDETGNYIALNLAWLILSGQLSWQDARRMYAETVLKNMHGHLRNGLLFRPIPNQGDPDQNWVFVAQQAAPPPPAQVQQIPQQLQQQQQMPLPMAPAQLLQQALTPQQQSQHAALQSLMQQSGTAPHPVQRRRAEDEAAASQQGTSGRRIYGR